jgi:hypothetical protein
MPATAATLTFTPLTNARIWFASPAAFNNFMGAITVSISGANLPDATTTTLGGVKKLEIASFSAVAAVTGSVNIVADDGATVVPVPQAAAYASAVARLDYLEAYLLALYNQLAAKGYV